MILPSRLSATTLGDLLGKLYRQRTTGSLELVELWAPPGTRSARHEIHLFCGLVSSVETTLAATPLGRTVVATARVESVGERQIAFSVEAHDGVERIGSGTHVRTAVDVARFERHVATKLGGGG